MSAKSLTKKKKDFFGSSRSLLTGRFILIPIVIVLEKGGIIMGALQILAAIATVLVIQGKNIFQPQLQN